MRWGLPLAAALATAPALAVSIDWVRVGMAGNAADERTGFGAVDYAYRIGKYEVTNAQYTEFLNAVAVADPNALYNTRMASGLGGIARSGGAGSYSYDAIVGREQMPVVFVSFYDALRFANWMHNDQLAGARTRPPPRTAPTRSRPKASQTTRSGETRAPRSS